MLERIAAAAIAALLISTAVRAEPYVEANRANSAGRPLRVIPPLVAPSRAEVRQRLGLQYETGDGVPQDFREAARWYRLAAVQGLAEAQNSLGVLYQKGLGVPQDYGESAKWLRLAAEQGLAFGEGNLGLMYANGVRTQ